VNDFHGAVEHNARNGELGIARLGGFFEAKRQSNPYSFMLSSGDMWQGSADSNITKGRLMVDTMNDIGFSAMAIGNHEFDWMDTTIIDNEENMNFPLLGVNVIDKRTNQRAQFVEPYLFLDAIDFQVGIIGTIGSNLESSILASAVSNYDFIPYTSLVIAASETLRLQGADLIILLNHDGTVEPGVLPYVDGVFNGHTHRIDRQIIQSKPVYQASAYGRAIGHMRFSYNPQDNDVEFLSLQSGVYSYDDLLSLNQFPSPSTSVEAIYNTYLIEEINEIKNEVIGTAVGDFSSNQLGRLAVEEMLTFAQTLEPSVLASFHNFGGVRAGIPSGEVTYGDLYRAFPFDNEIVILPVTGTELNWWLAQSNHIKTISSMPSIQSSSTYYIVTINYLSEKHWENEGLYPHDEDQIINSFNYIREVLKGRWLDQSSIQASFYS
jgi:2',3'-cyclic-nucleotide 2'-phosphodiesterase (5'-nucleotidase family)